MRREWKKIVLSALIIFLGLACGKKADAAVKGVWIPCDKIVKKYDVTGDGQKDSIKIYCEKPDKYNEGLGSDWRIKVNNKIVYREKYEGTDFLTVQFFKVSSNKIYFDVVERGDANDHNSGHLLYLVVDGKWKKVCDFHEKVRKNVTGWGYAGEIESITENKMKVGFYCQYFGVGGVRWKVQYTLENGVWKPTQNQYKITLSAHQNSDWTVSRKISMLKNPGGTKVAFTVKKGDKLRIGNICFKNNRTYVQFTFGEKTGWFKTPKEDWNDYFKGVQYAG